MKKKEKWMKFRHRVAWVILYPILAVITLIKFPIRVEKLKDRRDRPYLILFNHQTPFDQFFVALAFKGPIYFISTEDILSNGFVSKVIKWLLAPIPIKKQAGDFSAVMTTLRVAREGATIAMALKPGQSAERTHINSPFHIFSLFVRAEYAVSNAFIYIQALADLLVKLVIGQFCIFLRLNYPIDIALHLTAAGHITPPGLHAVASLNAV